MKKKLTYGGALNQAIDLAMSQNENVFCLGEDIGLMGGSFGITRGLMNKYGEDRVIDTPISEAMIAGAAVGAAATGMVPIAEIMFSDFMTYCFDQLVNQAAKMRYMYGGNIELPLVIRFPGGGGIQAAAQHSQNLENLLVHIPGLKVVYPTTVEDARGLMLAAIQDKNPVMFFEHKYLYAAMEQVEEEFEPIPLGKASIRKEGKDVTIVATGYCVNKSLNAAKKLEEEGISVEVIDPRTLFPLDTETIYKSIDKTGKLVVVTEENKRSAWSAEMAALAAEDKYDSLKAKIVRIGALNTPTPFAKDLEDYVLPQEIDIINGVKEIC
ncbi:MAG: alpha-ketoacid dehydrogenase subunit beta [Clostridia bacterium]|nr:alpha-ketoacid dehydrogenase subunit beta [Clostridia bacterium]